MTAPRIDELLALSEKATVGEWVASNCAVSARGMRSIIATTYVPASPSSYQYENAAFIAAACNFIRQDLPALLAEREALTRMLDAYRRTVNRIDDLIEYRIGLDPDKRARIYDAIDALSAELSAIGAPPWPAPPTAPLEDE